MLYAASGHPDVDIDSIATALNLDRDLIERAARVTINAGWAHDTEDYDGRLDITLSDTGVEKVSQYRTTYSNGKRRATASREAFLDWLYDKDEGSGVSIRGFIADHRSFFYGQRFTDDALTTAAQYLAEAALIDTKGTSQSNVLRASINVPGRQCVEDYDGNVSAFLNRGARSATTYSTNIHGSTGFQVANNSPDATMHSTVVMTDDHRTQILEYADQVAEHIVNLSDEVRPEAEATLAEIRTANDEGNWAKVKSGLQKLAGVILVAGTTEAGQKIWEVLRDAIHSIGGVS